MWYKFQMSEINLSQNTACENFYVTSQRAKYATTDLIKWAMYPPYFIEIDVHKIYVYTDTCGKESIRLS